MTAGILRDIADSAALAALPEAIRQRVLGDLDAFRSAADQAGIRPTVPADLADVMVRVWAFSRFVSRWCIRYPEQLAGLLRGGELFSRKPAQLYNEAIRGALAVVDSREELADSLRIIRLREMVRIAWRDLANWADVDETMEETSALADAILDNTLDKLHQWQCREFGVPADGQGTEQRLVVLGMGKLGARELNFSSDIDLIFAYPEDGVTTGSRAALSNEEYFVRLGRSLINVLDVATDRGRVYRVDMRLRPFGKAGPLVMSFDALETYYQAHGRQWERYALIKARVVAGDRAAGERLMDILRPFVYRRYLDFSSFEELRGMKRRIESEVRRKGMERNIKLGAGGIREIEFIGQAFQLIRGGREPELQQRAIQKILLLLAASGYLPEYATRELVDAYRFLRRVENRLQEYGDEQVHRLPDVSEDRERLALSAGFSSAADFEKELARHMTRVHDHFEQLIAVPQADAADDDRTGLAGVWQGSVDAEAAQALLAGEGFDDPGEALRLLKQLRKAGVFRALTPQGHERLDQLMPLLLSAVANTDQPAATLQRLIRLIETIARRTTYLTLLVEHPMALSQLVKLGAASPWINQLLIRSPILLDELLDPRTLYAPLDRAALEDEIRQTLARIPEDDLEAQMDALRHFRQINVLRVAAADVAGVYPLMVVSDHLTEIAIVALQQVLELAIKHLAPRFGRPRCRSGDQDREAGFAIVGYGKLGGIELGYGSDLDLVFIYDDTGEEQQTTGPAVVDNEIYFVRLGQRIIHIMSTATSAGVLYDLDMRLRPSGKSGLLVSGLSGFADYQRRQAWTWEHQALVRARAVVGDTGLVERFDELRREILATKRDPVRLRDQVLDMRARMLAEHGTRAAGHFDLKQDEGAISDIEFIVQYGVLRHAHEYPELLRWTDNIRLLETLSRVGVMAERDAAVLSDAYRVFRAAVHRLTLQDQPTEVAADEFEIWRAAVRRIWREFLENAG